MVACDVNFNIEDIIIGVESITYPSLFSSGDNLYTALHGVLGGPTDTGLAVPEFPNSLNNKKINKNEILLYR